MVDFDDDELIEDEEAPGMGLGTTPEQFAIWLEDQFRGEERFDAIEIQEDDLLEGEDVRVAFEAAEGAFFFCSVLVEQQVVRVGLAVDDEELSEEIEQTALDDAGSLTEFVSHATESVMELDHEVEHFHDVLYFFASDLPISHVDDLGNQELRDEVIYYLEAYYDALNPLLSE